MASLIKTVVLASRNEGKIREIRQMLAEIGIGLDSLNDYPQIPEIAEDGESFLENALIKARTVAEATGQTVLADDSGLEVDALGGAPGIYSARFAGAGADDSRNNEKLLAKLQGVPASQRGAAFRCVLVLYPPDGTYEAFEGRWEGRILEQPAGSHGFGYDPLFFVPEIGMTAAQLPAAVKNRISHRGQAFQKLTRRLSQLIDGA